MYKLIKYLILGVFLASCVQDPYDITVNDFNIDRNSAIIICEGLYGFNNSSITLFSLSSGKVNGNIFKQVNGFDLGDIANSSILVDSCLYIIVSTSRVLYKISQNNLKILNILTFPEGTYPRQIIANDSSIFVTEAYSNKFYVINRNQFKIIDSIVVGAQPEGLCILNGFLYIVNSGWGDINAKHPEASTIYKINLNNLNIIHKVKTYSNPVEIIADTNNNLIYVTYYNLPSQKDSVGGIIVYDENLIQKKHIRGNFLKTKILNKAQLLSLIDNNPSIDKNQNPGLALINLENNSINTILKNSKKMEFWYNFYHDSNNNQVWICNAMDFQSNGKIEIYNTNTSFTKFDLIKNFYTGLNPNQILLWK